MEDIFYSMGSNRKVQKPTNLCINLAQEPILKLINLQLQRQRYSGIKHLLTVEENNFVSKTQ
jgi:hypothetical protein